MSAESARGEPHSRSGRESRAAFVLACVALAAAIVAAIGPAEHLTASHSWPPKALPATETGQVWYTPLLLAGQTPAALTARIPCSPTMAHRHASGAITISATARHLDSVRALSVVRSGKRLVVRIGDRRVATVPLLRGATPTCAYVLHVEADRLSIRRPNGSAQSTALVSMPLVDGLFSELSLHPSSQLSVEVRTQVYATKPVLRQALAWIAAVLAIVLALALVSRGGAASRMNVRHSMSQAARRVRAADVVVIGALVAWLILSPSFVDDGEVLERGQMYSHAGGFSSYYAAFGVNLPNDYWLEWLQHWFTESSTSLPLLRLPALACLATSWVICRWLVSRALGSASAGRRLTVWTLAGAFLVGAFSWGMTLRPEFATSLLAVAALACTARFLEAGTTLPLALAACLIPLAVTAHHSGIVAVAPVIVASPTLLGWARRQFCDGEHPRRRIARAARRAGVRGLGCP